MTVPWYRSAAERIRRAKVAFLEPVAEVPAPAVAGATHWELPAWGHALKANLDELDAKFATPAAALLPIPSPPASLAPADPTPEATEKPMPDLAQTIEADVETGLKDTGAFFSGLVAKVEGKAGANPANVSTLKSALSDAQSAATAAQAAAAKLASAIPAAAEEGLADFIKLLEGGSADLKTALLNAGISKLTSLLPSS